MIKREPKFSSWLKCKSSAKVLFTKLCIWYTDFMSFKVSAIDQVVTYLSSGRLLLPHWFLASLALRLFWKSFNSNRTIFTIPRHNDNFHLKDRPLTYSPLLLTTRRQFLMQVIILLDCKTHTHTHTHTYIYIKTNLVKDCRTFLWSFGFFFCNFHACVVFWPFDPAKNSIPRWCTGRRWHILMAVIRGNSVGGNWLMKWDELKKFPWYTHRRMHRKSVTSELHDSYFRLMTIKHSISKIEWALNDYIIQLSSTSQWSCQ